MALICPNPECKSKLIATQQGGDQDRFRCMACGMTGNEEREWEYFEFESQPKKKIHRISAHSLPLCNAVNKHGVVTTEDENKVTCRKCLQILAKRDFGEKESATHNTVVNNKETNRNLSFFAGMLAIIIAFSVAFGIQQQQIQELKEQIKSKSEIQEIVYKSIPEPETDALNATVTAYTASEDETDSTPNQTALMTEPVPGWTCAVSRDLGVHLGDRVWIEGFGVRRVTDFMNKRYEKSIDLCVGNKSIANKVGRSEREVVFYER